MLDILFFSGLALYFAGVIAHFLGLAFRNDKIAKAAWLIFYAGFALNFAYMAARGITAHRLPLANQFEFATAFAWCIGLLAIILHRRTQEAWLGALTTTAAFLILSFAALQQIGRASCRERV